jgi:hypothetical protein
MRIVTFGELKAHGGVSTFYSCFRMHPRHVEQLVEDIIEAWEEEGPFTCPLVRPRKDGCEAKVIMCTLLLYLSGVPDPAIRMIMDMSKSCVTKNIKDALLALNGALGKFIFRGLYDSPNAAENAAELARIAAGFNEKTFVGPNGEKTMKDCVGALDTMAQPINMRDAGGNSQQYWHQKTGSPAILLAAVADSRYRFTWFHAGAPGKAGDVPVWELEGFDVSALGKYWVCADSAWSTSRHLLTAWRAQDQVSPDERLRRLGFNVRIAAAFTLLFH